MMQFNLISNQDAIIGGLLFAKHAFSLVDKKIKFLIKKKDGSFVKKKSLIATVQGKAQNILIAERVALNYLSHISGIATRTNQFVKLAGKKCKICCTRKTIPNLRVIQKYAVKLGGGTNHRFNLSDEYLIKDNHIASSKKFEEIIKKAIKSKKGKKITVEVDNLNQLNIWENVYDNVVDLSNKLNLGQQINIINYLDLMISMDSANGHLAANYNIPVLTLWGMTHPFCGFTPFDQPQENSITVDRNHFPYIPTSIFGNKIPKGYENAFRTIDPKIVILFGSTAMESLTSTNEKISYERGKWKEIILKNKTYPLMVTFNPSYLIRFPENKKFSWEDLKKIKQKILDLKIRI